MKEKGYLQIYTGNGKGKTTAALGLALRAAGAGKKVFIAQFAKGMKTSEMNSLKLFKKSITLKQYGRGCYISKKPAPEDVCMAAKGLADAGKKLKAGKCDVIILDEANIAVFFGLFSIGSLLKCIAERAPHVEVVVTGRNAHPLLLKKADLVTEMREIKHYYSKGVAGRSGIEK